MLVEDVSARRGKVSQQLSQLESLNQGFARTADILSQSGDAWQVRLGADDGTLQQRRLCSSSSEASRSTRAQLREWQGDSYSGKGGCWKAAVGGVAVVL